MGRKDAAVRISPQTRRVLERSTRTDFRGVTHWLIRQASHRAPEALASRLEEEWLADLLWRPRADLSHSLIGTSDISPFAPRHYS